MCHLFVQPPLITLCKPRQQLHLVVKEGVGGRCAAAPLPCRRMQVAAWWRVGCEPLFFDGVYLPVSPPLGGRESLSAPHHFVPRNLVSAGPPRAYDNACGFTTKRSNLRAGRPLPPPPPAAARAASLPSSTCSPQCRPCFHTAYPPNQHA